MNTEENNIQHLENLKKITLNKSLPARERLEAAKELYEEDKMSLKIRSAKEGIDLAQASLERERKIIHESFPELSKLPQPTRDTPLD